MDSYLQQQRLGQIVNSYALAGEEPKTFAQTLDRLADSYPWFLVELALVEVLAENWLRFPLPRGLGFLEQVQQRLQAWREAATVCSALTPTQFEQITGLVPLGFDCLKAPPIAFPDSRRRVVQSTLGDRPYPAN